MAGMVSREDKEPRASFTLGAFLLGFAAGEFVGGFVAGFAITACKKFGAWGGWNMEGHRAGTYDLPSRRRKAA